MILSGITITIDSDCFIFSILGFSNYSMIEDSDVRNFFGILIDWNMKWIGLDLLWFHIL